MPTTIDRLAIEFGAQWTGGGVVNRMLTDLSRVARATREVFDPVKMTSLSAGSSAAAKEFSVIGAAALKYQTLLASVESQMRELGQTMASTPHNAITPDQIASYRVLATQAEELKTKITAVNAATSDGTAALNRYITTLAPLAVGAGIVTAALVGLYRGFQSLRSAAEEGAQIRQTAVSFRFLSEEVYGASNVLEKMRAASRGTIPDFQLMSSYLTLMAGTTPEFGSALTNAVPQIIEIAKAANVLNPALGDTTFFFESLARGIKRTEYRLIDNLGLNVRVGEANKRYAEQLGKTVTQLTAAERQQAFLNEVLRVGGLLMDQVGGAVDSLVDPYARLTTAIQNAKDSFKSMLAEEMAARMVELSGGVLSLGESLSYSAESAARLAAALLSIPIDVLASSGIAAEAKALHREITSLTSDVPALNRAYFTYLNAIAPNVPTSQRAAEVEALRQQRDALQALANPELRYADLVTVSRAAVEASTVSLDKWSSVARDAADATEQVGDGFADLGFKPISIEPLLKAKQGLRELNLQWDKAFGDMSREARENAEKELGKLRETYSNAVQELVAARDESLAEANARRQSGIRDMWAELFAGGELDSDLINNIRNFGRAFVEIGGPTQEQRDRLEELNEKLEKAREKLWEVNQGIGVQGDKSEATAKKIEDLTAEIANYERVIGEVAAQAPPTAMVPVDFTLDLNDIEVYKRFVESLREMGGTSSQLSGVAAALGLISSETADALVKVSFLDEALRDIALRVAIGDITVENGADAARQVIAALEQDISAEELVLQVRADIGAAKQQAVEDWRADRKTGDVGALDINANISPALEALGVATGVITGTETKTKIAADTKPFMDDVAAAKAAVERMTVTLKIKGVYEPPSDMPKSTTSTTRTGRYSTFASGGYVPGSRGQALAAIVHAGEFVMRPEAVDRLGVGFLNSLNQGLASARNNVSVQANFYAPVGNGGGDVRELVLKAGDDAATQLVDILKRSGYSI